jgi:hypothetical protein
MVKAIPLKLSLRSVSLPYFDPLVKTNFSKKRRRKRAGKIMRTKL